MKLLSNAAEQEVKEYKWKGGAFGPATWIALQQNGQMTRVRNEYKKPNPIKSEYGITPGSAIHCNRTRLKLSLQINGTCEHKNNTK